MTPDIFRQSKNLFLIFPPGTGGNHFANLLSMHPVFAPRYTHDKYYEDMAYKYQFFFIDSEFCTAHFSDLENLQYNTLAEFESKIVNHKEPYIFCAHVIEYLIRKSEGKLDAFNNQIFCLFSKPTGKNKLVNDRMREGSWYYAEQDDMHYMGTNVKSLYHKSIFALDANVDPDKIFTLDTDIFYTVDGYDYINETVKINLGFELPEICRKMHTRYIEYSSIIFGKVDK